jgi:hypothetical protein
MQLQCAPVSTGEPEKHSTNEATTKAISVFFFENWRSPVFTSRILREKRGKKLWGQGMNGTPQQFTEFQTYIWTAVQDIEKDKAEFCCVCSTFFLFCTARNRFLISDAFVNLYIAPRSIEVAYGRRKRRQIDLDAIGSNMHLFAPPATKWQGRGVYICSSNVIFFKKNYTIL